MRNPNRSPASKAGKYRPEDLAFIRDNIGSMNDVAIASALGWKAWKVLAVRQANGIPAHVPQAAWTDEQIEVLKERYIRRGLPASVVGSAIGKTGLQVAHKAAGLGLKRDPAHQRRNIILQAAKNSPFKPGHGIRRHGCARDVVHDTPEPPRAQPRLTPRNFGNSTFRFRPRTPADEPLGGRILSVLAERPMSASELAVVVGEKELSVSIQLAALAHHRQVSPETTELVRSRRWRAAA